MLDYRWIREVQDTLSVVMQFYKILQNTYISLGFPPRVSYKIDTSLLQVTSNLPPLSSGLELDFRAEDTWVLDKPVRNEVLYLRE
jgi:hypothetical protein